MKVIGNKRFVSTFIPVGYRSNRQKYGFENLRAVWRQGNQHFGIKLKASIICLKIIICIFYWLFWAITVTHMCVKNRSDTNSCGFKL